MISVKSQKQNIKISLEAFCAFLPWAILTFSAPLAFYSGLLMLFFLSFWYPSRFARITLAVCIVVGGAIGFGDTILIGDKLSYYTTYTNIFNGNFDAIFDYGKGCGDHHASFLGSPCFCEWVFGSHDIWDFT